jgi:hypothetical protein
MRHSVLVCLTTGDTDQGEPDQNSASEHRSVSVQIVESCGCCVVQIKPKVQPMNILLELEPGRALPLAAQGHPLLQVRSGRVWLTRRNDPVDHFLGRGDQLLLSEGDGVVVEATGAEPVRLSLSRPPGWQGLIADLWWRLASLALSRLQATAQSWPPELLELDEHALQDVGAPAGIRTAVRNHREARLLRAEQLRLSVAS